MEEVLFSISLHCRIQMCWSHWRKPLRLYAVMSAGTMENSWAVVIKIRKHHWIRLLSCCWLQSSAFKNTHVSCGMYAVAYVCGDGLHSGTCKLCLQKWMWLFHPVSHHIFEVVVFGTHICLILSLSLSLSHSLTVSCHANCFDSQGCQCFVTCC